MPMSYVEVKNGNGEVQLHLQFKEHLGKCNALIDTYKRDFVKFRKKPSEKMAMKMLKELEYIHASINLSKNAYRNEPWIVAALSASCNEAVMLQEANLIYGYYRTIANEKNLKSIEELARASRQNSNSITLAHLLSKLNKNNFESEDLSNLKELKDKMMSIRAERSKLSKLRITASNTRSQQKKEQSMSQLDKDELILRNQIIAKLKSLISDPNVNHKLDRSLWKVINYQNQKIAKLVSKFPEMDEIYLVNRRKEDFIGRITKGLESFRPEKQTVENWLDVSSTRENWDSMIRAQLPGMEIQNLGGGNNPIYKITDQKTKSVVIARKFALQAHYLEDEARIGKSHFMALRRAKQHKVDHHFAEMYSYIEMGKTSNGDKIYLEISEPLPMDMTKRLANINLNTSLEGKISNVSMFGQAMLKMLCDFKKSGIYYPDFKPSNIMVDSNGNLRVSDVKSLFVRDGSGTVDTKYVEITPSYTNTQSEAEKYQLDLEAHEKISMAVCLYELATGAPPPRIKSGKSVAPHNFDFNLPIFSTRMGQEVKSMIIKLADPKKEMSQNIEEAKSYRKNYQIDIALGNKIKEIAEGGKLADIEIDEVTTFNSKNLSKIFDLSFENDSLSQSCKSRYPEYLQVLFEDVYRAENRITEINEQVSNVNKQIKQQNLSMEDKAELLQFEKKLKQEIIPYKEYLSSIFSGNLYGQIKIQVRMAKKMQQNNSEFILKQKNNIKQSKEISERIESAKDKIRLQQELLHTKSLAVKSSMGDRLLESEIKLLKLDLQGQKQYLDTLEQMLMVIEQETSALDSSHLTKEFIDQLHQELTHAMDAMQHLDQYIQDMSKFMDENKDYYASSDPYTIEQALEELAALSPVVANSKKSSYVSLEKKKELLAELKEVQKPIASKIESQLAPVQKVKDRPFRMRNKEKALEANQSVAFNEKRESIQKMLALQSKLLDEVEKNPKFKKKLQDTEALPNKANKNKD